LPAADTSRAGRARPDRVGWRSPLPSRDETRSRRSREQSSTRHAVEPFKHVIDEYKHQAQTITCTCGWHGSSATIDRTGSEWTAHLIEVRGKKR
jgi:hypothetical protein